MKTLTIYLKWVKKWAKYLIGTFSKKDIQMTNKYEKIYSKSLVINKCKLKSQCTTIKFIKILQNKNKNPDITKYSTKIMVYRAP